MTLSLDRYYLTAVGSLFAAISGFSSVAAHMIAEPALWDGSAGTKPSKDPDRVHAPTTKIGARSLSSAKDR